jgi:fructokinase
VKKTVVSFGEILWDILPSCRVLGGAPFNFVFRVNSLGDSGLIISRLGQDSPGQKAVDKVSTLGLETTYIQWDASRPTGTVQVSFDQHKNPDYLIVPQVAYDHIQLTDSLLDIASKADCICFGTLIQREGQSRDTLRRLLENSHHSLKFCDINLRKKCYDRDTVAFSLDSSHVVKMNEDEARQLAQMFGFSYRSISRLCEQLVERWSLRYCLVTLAQYGAYALSESGEEIYVPGYGIELADSLGAGDAFSAGFIHEILRGATVAQACGLGNIMGALVAAQKGATAVVTKEDIDGFGTEGIALNIHQEFL